jgi:hypothetical protein
VSFLRRCWDMRGEIKNESCFKIKTKQELVGPEGIADSVSKLKQNGLA